MRRSIAGIAVVVLVALSVGVAAPASAISPDIPPPINILPSTIVGGKAAISKTEGLAIQISGYAKDPTFWQGVQRKAAGAATAADDALLAAEKTRFAVPMTKAAPISKLVAGANIPMAGLSLGMLAGNGATRLAGFKDNDVCQENNGVLEVVSFITNGVSCNAFDNAIKEAQRNLDAKPSTKGESVCVGGFCVQMMGSVPANLAPDTDTQPCFKASGPTPPLANLVGTFSNGELINSAQNSIGSYNGTFCYDLTGPGFWFVHGQPAVVESYWIETTSGVTSPVASPVTTRANPMRNFKCTTGFSDGTSAFQLSDGFTENDPVFAPIKCPVIPDGKTPVTQTVTEEGGTAPLPLYNQPVSPEYQRFKTEFAECGEGTCPLHLFEGETNCHVDPARCADWFSDPNKTDKYACKYGGHAVALSECNTYAPTFKPGAKETGRPYGNPETGETPSSQTGPVPGSAGGGAGPAGSPCWPQGWSAIMNPASWVLMPVMCALRSAFVPKPSDIGGLKAEFDARAQVSAIGNVSKALVGLESIFSVAAGGCMGPPWRIAIFDFDETYYPFNACAEPVAGIASAVKGMASFGVVLMSLLAIIRSVVAIFGFVGLGTQSGIVDAIQTRGQDDKK